MKDLLIWAAAVVIAVVLALAWFGGWVLWHLFSASDERQGEST